MTDIEIARKMVSIALVSFDYHETASLVNEGLRDNSAMVCMALLLVKLIKQHIA